MKDENDLITAIILHPSAFILAFLVQGVGFEPT
jgi:hypothetical protein